MPLNAGTRTGAIVAAKQADTANEPDTGSKMDIDAHERRLLTTTAGLRHLIGNGGKVKKALRTLRYDRELELLQIELVRLQRDVQENGRRVAIIFEGRDAAGKGGTIRRFMEHLNPRAARVVALTKPTTTEAGQWYFQRYVQNFPTSGE